MYMHEFSACDKWITINQNTFKRTSTTVPILVCLWVHNQKGCPLDSEVNITLVSFSKI